MSTPPFCPGDLVTTDYLPREARRVRTVISCTPNSYSQTRWWVLVDGLCGMGGVGIDSAWFKKYKDDR